MFSVVIITNFRSYFKFVCAFNVQYLKRNVAENVIGSRSLTYSIKLVPCRYRGYVSEILLQHINTTVQTYHFRRKNFLIIAISSLGPFVIIFNIWNSHCVNKFFNFFTLKDNCARKVSFRRCKSSLYRKNSPIWNDLSNQLFFFIELKPLLNWNHNACINDRELRAEHYPRVSFCRYKQSWL